MQKSSENTISENNEKISNIKENVESASSFFSISYIIILITSISYNVGYFKYINPQIVELFTITDYINNTLHSVWLFLIPIILFYSGLLAHLKKYIGRKFSELIMIGIGFLFISMYIFLSGSNRERIWLVFESFIGNGYFKLFAIILLIIFPIFFAFIIYKIYHAYLKDRFSKYAISILPIIVFLIIVLIPYLIGSVQGQIETSQADITKKTCHSISILKMDRKIMNDVYILKHIDKGLIVKQLSDHENKSNFYFVNWADILNIIYPDHGCFDKIKKDKEE